MAGTKRWTLLFEFTPETLPSDRASTTEFEFFWRGSEFVGRTTKMVGGFNCEFKLIIRDDGFDFQRCGGFSEVSWAAVVYDPDDKTYPFKRLNAPQKLWLMPKPQNRQTRYSDSRFDGFAFAIFRSFRPPLVPNVGLVGKEGPAPRNVDEFIGAFVAAGLPGLSMRESAIIGGGAGALPWLHHTAELVRTLLPEMERVGVTTAAEVDIEALNERLGREVAAGGSVIIGRSEIGAWSRVEN